MEPNARQQKAIEIAQSIINTAFAIRVQYAEPIPNSHLLSKRPFPNRKMPHRIKRQLKRRAAVEQSKRVAMSCLHAAAGAANIHRITTTPSNIVSQSYNPGGVFVKEGGDLNIVSPHISLEMTPEWMATHKSALEALRHKAE